MKLYPSSIQQATHLKIWLLTETVRRRLAVKSSALQKKRFQLGPNFHPIFIMQTTISSEKVLDL